MIYGARHSSEDCRFLKDYGAKYRHQSEIVGGDTTKHTKLDKNSMVKKSNSASLKGVGGVNKCTCALLKQ